jgi:DNA-binding Lrp family transcriptional regulator
LKDIKLIYVSFFFIFCIYKEYYSIYRKERRMDDTDLKILKYVQANASLPLSELSKRVGLSKTPCWNRIRKLEELGVIDKRVTVLNRNKLGLPIVVFLSISVSQHSENWTREFVEIISKYPQIVEVHRLTGSTSDYMLKIVASSIEDYDKFQQTLISELDFTSMSSSVSLQEMKYEVALPLNNVK